MTYLRYNYGAVNKTEIIRRLQIILNKQLRLILHLCYFRIALFFVLLFLFKYDRVLTDIREHVQMYVYEYIIKLHTMTHRTE